ncbi:MAG: hypothetical protein PVF91_15055 [Chromatiales bacterium]|jgi:hypothetical protein
MHGRPSLIFLLAAAAVIGWLAFNAGSERPTTYGTGSPSPQSEDRAADEEDAGGTEYNAAERRARIDSALRQKAARF